MSDIKGKALRGGSHLIARQILGVLIAFIGMTTLARTIGPANYGIFITASATAFYVFILCEFGIGTYLARRGGDAPVHLEYQAFSLLICFSIVAMMLLFIVAFGIGLSGALQSIMVPFIIGIPFQLLSVVPLARMERKLQYAIVARIELTGQIIFYGVALPYAFYHRADAWAPATAWLVQQIVINYLFYRYSRFRVGLEWNTANISEILRFGFGVSSAGWLWHLRKLVNPWIVGYLAGPEIVGIIALATRIVEALTFLQSSVRRMSVPMLGYFSDNKDRLLAMINETSQLLVPLVGLCLLGFSLCGPFVIHWLVGPKWDVVFSIYPFLAIAVLANCVVALHNSVLYVLGQGVDVVKSNAVSIILLGAASCLLVPLWGAIGYGIAELVALPSLCLLHFFVARQLGHQPHYGLSLLLWTACFSLGVFWPPMGIAASLMVLCYPPFWKGMIANVRHLRAAKPA